MLDKNGFFAMRYYPVPISDGDGGAFPIYVSYGVFALSARIQDEENYHPTLLDKNENSSREYAVAYTHTSTDGFTKYTHNALIFDPFFDELELGEFVEQLLILTDENGDPVHADQWMEQDEFNVYISGLGSIAWYTEDGYWQGDALPFVNENSIIAMSAGVLDIGLYENGTFQSLATLRMSAPMTELLPEGASWDHPDLPLPKNVWKDHSNHALIATLKGNAPKPVVEEPSSVPGRAGRSDLVMRWYPVEGVQSSSDAGGIFGIAAWLPTQDALFNEGAKSMIPLYGKYETIANSVYSNLWANSIWYMSYMPPPGMYYELAISLTKPPVAEPLQFTLPLDVFIVGMSEYGLYLYNPEEEAWVVTGDRLLGGGVFEVGIHMDGYYYSLSATRIMNSNFIPKPNGESWSHPKLPRPTHREFYDSRGLLKTTLKLDIEIPEEPFWTELKGTEEVI